MSSIVATPGAKLTSHDVVVVGCGNLLRGDDGAGPECVRLLAEGGLPPGVVAIDAGTSGADVVLCMRGANRVILIDACRSGRPPGSLIPLSAAELAEIPAAGPLDIHAFCWIDAVRLTRALAGQQPGPTIAVWLVEAAEFAPGSGLSPPVAAAVAQLAAQLAAQIRASQIRAALEPAARQTTLTGD
jgi:hydrogenase maturation protease